MRAPGDGAVKGSSRTALWVLLGTMPALVLMLTFLLQQNGATELVQRKAVGPVSSGPVTLNTLKVALQAITKQVKRGSHFMEEDRDGSNWEEVQKSLEELHDALSQLPGQAEGPSPGKKGGKRNSQASNDRVGTLPIELREAVSSLKAATSSMLQAPQPAEGDEGGQLRCDFDYEGPLRPADLNCFIEYFPFATPVDLVTLGQLGQQRGQGRRSVAGIAGDAESGSGNGTAAVPIFIPFRDRVSVLIETLRSFHRHITTPFEVVIFNDQSSHPVAVRFLERLAAAGVTVETNTEPWGSHFKGLMAKFSPFVSRYLEASTADYYVITDPDCALDSAPGDILTVYQRVLESNASLVTVGAALRWDDWPSWVPDKYEMDFVRLPSSFYQFGRRNYYYIDAPVDTTFAMHRKSTPPGRLLKPAIRLLPPLGVRHLDYYLDPDNLPDDYVYYHKIARSTGHINHVWHLETSTTS